MSKRRRGRPRDEARIAAMRSCCEAALATCRSVPLDTRRTLYGGAGSDGFGFAPRPGWTFDRQMQSTLQLLRGDTEGVPEDFIDWHGMERNERPIGKMAAYDAAAALFNASLEFAQRSGHRLDEKPTKGSALQRMPVRDAT